jgi:hypothetical protein
VSRGAIIDLLDNPGALPADKPGTVQVGVAAAVNGHVQNINVTLTPIEYDTTLNLVTYYQLNPVTLSWPGVEGETLTLHDLSSHLDPSGSFNATATDFGAPSTFTTTFTFPTFSPTLYGPVSFSASVGGVVTDGTGVPNGVSYTPTGTNPGVFQYQLLDTTSAPIATFFQDPGASFAAGPPNTHTTGPFDNTGSPVVVSAGPNGVGTVVVTSSFTGSGGTDQYSFNGRWDVVPEPNTMVLAGLGVAGLGALAIRRRQARCAR